MQVLLFSEELHKIILYTFSVQAFSLRKTWDKHSVFCFGNKTLLFGPPVESTYVVREHKYKHCSGLSEQRWKQLFCWNGTCVPRRHVELNSEFTEVNEKLSIDFSTLLLYRIQYHSHCCRTRSLPVVRSGNATIICYFSLFHPLLRKQIMTALWLCCYRSSILYTCCFVFIVESGVKMCFAVGEGFKGPYILREFSKKFNS